MSLADELLADLDEEGEDTNTQDVQVSQNINLLHGIPYNYFCIDYEHLINLVS